MRIIAFGYNVFFVLIDCSQSVHFPVRSSRSRASRYGLPILHECQNYLSYNPRRDARPLAIGAFENQDSRDGKRRGISKRSHEKIGDCEQSIRTKNTL